MVGGLRHRASAKDVGDVLALGDQLLSGFELADDLIRAVADSFMVKDPAQPGG